MWAGAAFPLTSAYCASKFALEGLSESLRVELHDEGIAVSVVNPGVVQTGFFDAAQGTRPAGYIPPQRGMSPAAVAKVLLQAARRPCRNRYLTLAGKCGIALQWLAPGVFDYLLLRAQRKKMPDLRSSIFDLNRPCGAIANRQSKFQKRSGHFTTRTEFRPP